MDLCETPITTDCPWDLSSNSTAGVLPESMLRLHIIVPAVTVLGLIVLGTLLGMVIYILRRPQAMAESGVAEGGKGKWYEDSESGSEQNGSVGITGMSMGADSMEIIRRETALVWANFGPPPKMPVPSAVLLSPPPIPAALPSPPISASQRPTRSLVPPPRPYRAPNRYTYPNQQQPIHIQPPPQQEYAQPRSLTQSHSQPEMRQHEYLHPPPPPPPPQTQISYPQPRNLTQSHSKPEMRQPEMRQREKGHITFVTRLEYPDEQEGTLSPASKWDRPNLGLGIRQSIDQDRDLQQQNAQKGKGKEKRERLVRSRRFSVSQNF
ncbi:hypothetical protein QBC36DRAFT_218150 [Triangularia setosa]|uniref:Uncharacterized protein n=1 Tax=Triangularia setosa TaxID=2587417 RepID=A0AAN6W5A6_9PEZI|nr:hypothetical protein QBC36DRAFT_218150 [Podospora setosa]